MENDNKKIILVAYVASSAVAYLVVRVLFQSLAVSFGVFGRLWANDTMQHAAPLVVAFLVFGILSFNGKIRAWADEVVSEIRKVVWPSKKDTTAMTIVTCVMLIIAGIVLGLFDFLSSNLIKTFLSM